MKKNSPSLFKPNWRYNKAGDTIEAYWEDCLCIGHRINNHITLYRKNDKEGEIIGVELSGIRHEINNTEKLESLRAANKELVNLLKVARFFVEIDNLTTMSSVVAPFLTLIDDAIAKSGKEVER